MSTPFVTQKNKSIKNVEYLYVTKHLPEFKGVMISVIIPNQERS